MSKGRTGQSREVRGWAEIGAGTQEGLPDGALGCPSPGKGTVGPVPLAFGFFKKACTFFRADLEHYTNLGVGVRY